MLRARVLPPAAAIVQCFTPQSLVDDVPVFAISCLPVFFFFYLPVKCDAIVKYEWSSCVFHVVCYTVCQIPAPFCFCFAYLRCLSFSSPLVLTPCSPNLIRGKRSKCGKRCKSVLSSDVASASRILRSSTTVSIRTILP